VSSYRVPRLLITALSLILCLGALGSVLLLGFPLNLYQSLGFVTGSVGIIGSRILHSKRALMMIYTVVVLGGTITAVPVIEKIWIDQHLILKEHRAEMIGDPRLYERIAPYSGGHDANGFRNDSVPDHADIVVLGDSQTWGYNVERDDIWSNVLHDLTGQTVYNMANSGFGPVQYWVLAGDALAQFSPETIIVGLYFGNDFYDAYRLVYLHDRYASLRQEQPDDELFLDPIKETFDVIVYRELTLRYEDDKTGTVFTPIRRLLALDDHDPRIAEGVRITEQLLLDMAEMTRAAHTRFVVLLIPTKELVYAEKMPEGKSPTFDLVFRRETRLRDQITTYLDENGIDYVDVLPTWRAALDNHQAIYNHDNDGHPTAEGHRLLAELLDDYLKGN
jgi:lysophospholipase L1-like esterase